MRVEAAFAAHPGAVPRCVSSSAQIRGQRGARGGRMVQVQRRCRRTAASGGRTPAFRSRAAQLLVLRTPALEGLVETIDAHQVVAPEALVAALDGDEAVGERARQRRTARASAVDRPGAVRRARATRTSRAACRIGEQLARQRLVGVHAHALREEPAPRDSRVIGDESGMQQHVAVDEHEVVARGRGDARGCAGARHAKARVRLRDACAPGRRTGRRSAATTSLRRGARSRRRR